MGEQLKQAELRLQDEQKRETGSPADGSGCEPAHHGRPGTGSPQSGQLSAAQQAANGQPSKAEQQRAQLQVEREQQAYKSLYADNLVRQEHASTQPALLTVPSEANATRSEPTFDQRPEVRKEAPPQTVASEKGRKPLDFSPTKQPNFWLPEGTVMEAVLANKLDVFLLASGDLFSCKAGACSPDPIGQEESRFDCARD